MNLLTEDALLLCGHGGQVKVSASQSWVTVAGRHVLVATDPESCSISGCPNNIPAMGIKPCLTTLAVREGYSQLLRIDGHRIALDSVRGFTDGTPPGTVDYDVRNAGQPFVASDE
jgi:hypothetical protein